ncbi:MAG: VanZ family protein [Flavisolibacter sp.]
MLKWKLWQSKWLAISYFVLISILFFLPGSALPESDWLTKIDFDKFVHVGLFALLLFICRSAFNVKIKNYSLLLFIGAVLYGFLVEVIQLKWIPNRSFDLYDVVADSLGSFLGLFTWTRVYKKNKPL